jgi:multicomponent Na+:H+ antiporter subunit E
MMAATIPTKRQSLAWRATGLTLAWLVVAGPAPAGWLIGLPTVALATWVSLRLAPPLPYRVSFLGLLSFLGYFVRESLRGGWDVAVRTLSRRMRIQPGQAYYTCSLPEGLPIVLFAGCVSLLPGTLSQRFDDRQLTLHLLDVREPQDAQLRKLEIRIARMLGIWQEATHD